VNLIELRPEERVVAFLNIQDFERREDFLFFATASGKVKRTSLKDFRNVNRGGIIAVNLNEGDVLIDVVHTTGSNHVLLATAGGMSIRFDESDARVMGRNAAGVKGIELAEDDKVVGLIRVEVDDDADLLTVSENGYGKRTSLSEYLVQQEDGTTRPQSRGGKGRIDIKTTERNGRVVAVRCLREGDSVMFISQGGMLVRVAAKSISHIGRNTQGVRLVNLKEGDKLIAAARIADSESDSNGQGETPPPSEPDVSPESSS
jgi:DNA gyrase subunit A